MTALTPAEVLDQIAARADAATDGPWFLDDEGATGIYTEAHVSETSADVAHAFKAEDEAFIAASRTDVPRLVAALRAVEKVLTDAEARAAESPARTFDGQPFAPIIFSTEIRAAITSALGGEA